MERTPGQAKRTARGVAAGGGLLFGAMAALAGLAIVLGIIRPEPAADLTPWLVLEFLVGSVVCVAAGWLSCRVGTARSPAILAGSTLVIGALEATMVARSGAEGGVSAPVWLVWAAPFAGALGVLLGGSRRGSWRTRSPGERGPRCPGVAVPPALAVAATAVALTALPRVDGEMDVVAAALTLDFTLALPAAVYWFWVRARRAPWIALLPAFAIGYAIAAATLPTDRRAVLDGIGWLVLPTELGLVAWLFIAGRRAYARASRDAPDFATRCRAAALETLGARVLADIFTTEATILYYALRVGRQGDGGGEPARFTTHREAGYSTIVMGLSIALVVEAAALHLLLGQWSRRAAWILTCLGIYGLVWIVGDLRACVARPVTIAGGRLRLRLGIRWEAHIPLAGISSVARIDLDSRSEVGEARTISILGRPNVRLVLESPVELIGLYGIRRTTRDIRLRIDGAGRFCEAMWACGVPGRTGRGPVR